MQFAGNSFVTRSILVAATADRSQIDDQVERWLASEECLDADDEDEPEGGLTLKTFIAHLTANIMKAITFVLHPTCHSWTRLRLRHWLLNWNELPMFKIGSSTSF